jgi:serine/threonine protein phosphatase PrpC
MAQRTVHTNSEAPVEPRAYIQRLLLSYGYDIEGRKAKLFEEFVTNENNKSAVNTIIENQKLLMDKWKMQSRINDIMQQAVLIPNANVNKPYEAKIDFDRLNWNDLSMAEFEGFEECGLTYDISNDMLKGLPDKSGDFKIRLRFKVEGEDDASAPHEKFISFVVNPDPKSLWKDKPSDKNDPFWKEDNVSAFGKLGEKSIVVASKRGRSHANVGSFRDDDFAFTHLERTGWNVVAVSDGAGSAKASRKGSEMACKEVIRYFTENFTEEKQAEFDSLLKEIKENKEEGQKKLNKFVYTNLGNAALSVHKKLEQFAAENKLEIKDLHSTLIFCLFKKHENDYAIMSFGVGDCPIGLLNKDMTEITLMNKLDVGDYGGGTRFITMADIFSSDKFAGRFGFKLIEDFSYLVLMTDGIYDPKFSVEANLEKIDEWKDFFSDLKGSNPDRVTVEFKGDNPEIEKQLMSWMDFWSPGNHDDRTLAVIF